MMKKIHFLILISLLLAACSDDDKEKQPAFVTNITISDAGKTFNPDDAVTVKADGLQAIVKATSSKLMISRQRNGGCLCSTYRLQRFYWHDNRLPYCFFSRKSSLGMVVSLPSRVAM